MHFDPEITNNIQQIIFADDQLLSYSLIKQLLIDQGVLQKTTLTINGQQAIDTAKQIFEIALTQRQEGDKSPFKPIDLMVLDFQMPLKTGVQVY